jgi:hypothetical protein
LLHKLTSAAGVAGYGLAILDFILGPYLPKLANTT